MSDLIERLIRHERLLGQYLNDGSMWCEADEEELGYLMRDMDQWKLLMGLAINALRQPAPPTWTRVEDSDGPFIIGEQYMINTKSRGVVLANAVLDEHAIMVSGEDIENEHDITDVTHFVGPITPPEGGS